jgi:type VI protein secretion system component Hcp
VNARVDRLAEAQRKQIAGRSLSGTGSSGSFSRFMNKGRMAAGAGSYSSDLEPVSISKLMDASSLQLLDMCLKSTTIDSAVIIKRRGVGADFLRTYLRVEFTDLLITDFNWDEDDVIKEKIKFVCRKAQVQYSIENPDGSQGKPLAPGIWAANRQKS